MKGCLFRSRQGRHRGPQDRWFESRMHSAAQAHREVCRVLAWTIPRLSRRLSTGSLGTELAWVSGHCRPSYESSGVLWRSSHRPLQPKKKTTKTSIKNEERSLEMFLRTISSPIFFLQSMTNRVLCESAYALSPDTTSRPFLPRRRKGSTREPWGQVASSWARS